MIECLGANEVLLKRVCGYKDEGFKVDMIVLLC